MTNLPFDTYTQIYKDKPTENDHSKYLNLKANFVRMFDGVSEIDSCNVKSLENSVTVYNFRKSLTIMGDNPANITGNLLKFSEYALNDPLFDSLKQLEIFFKLNLGGPESIMKKVSRISQYLDEHPKKRSIANKEVEEIHNIIVRDFFNIKEMSISKANDLLAINDQDFFQVIDSKIDKTILESGKLK